MLVSAVTSSAKLSQNAENTPKIAASVLAPIRPAQIVATSMNRPADRARVATIPPGSVAVSR